MQSCLLCGTPDVPSFFNLPHPLCRPSSPYPCAPCAEMSQLETQITEAKEALSKMLAQHRELRTKMNYAHNSIIHRMPTESTSYIFEFPVHSYSLDDRVFSLTNIEICGPLILGAVCQVWRQIVLSSPRLWTTISLYFNTSKPSAQCEVLQQWLSRSGQLPLAFQVHSSSTNPTFHPIIDVINQYSNRWQYLYLHIPFMLLPRFCGSFEGAPILRRLRLHGHGENTGHGFKLRGTKPSPTDVSMSYLPLDNLHIERTQVTHLELDSRDLRECIRAMQYLPQLTHCKFSNIYYSAIPYSISGNVTHHRLRVLHFGSKGGRTGNFFRHVTLPALEVLTCRMKDLPTNELVSFFIRSSSALTTLSISQAQVNSNDVYRLRRAIPSLRKFQFLDMDIHSFKRILTFVSCLPSLSTGQRKADQALRLAFESICLLSPESNYVKGISLVWELVMDTAGTPSRVDSPDGLNLVGIEISLDLRDEEIFQYIIKDSIPRLFRLLEMGIDLKIQSANTDCDLVRLSRELIFIPQN